MLQPIFIIGESKLADLFSRSDVHSLPSWLSVPIVFHVNLFIAQRLFVAPGMKSGLVRDAFELRDAVLQAGGY